MPHKIPPPASTVISSVCSKCGSIAKSGKMSCCARGGSWFKNCGGAGNTRLQHTWYEGIQACKARSQSKTVVDQQLNGAQEKGTDPSQGAGMATYKAVIAATKTVLSTPANASTLVTGTTSIVTPSHTADNGSITIPVDTLTTNTAANNLMISSTHTSASMPIMTQGCTNVLKVTGHIFIFLHLGRYFGIV